MSNERGPGDIFVVPPNKRKPSSQELPPFVEWLMRSGPWIPLLGVLGLWAMMTSYFVVEPEEIGVVLRFGKMSRVADPGLGLKLPWGIEQIIKVPVQRQLKEEFGFRTAQAGVRSQYSRQSYSGESNMLTGDLNAAVVEWVVQYRVVKPEHFLFRVRDVRGTLRDSCEAIMREVVGDRTVNDVLTTGRQEIAFEVQTRLAELAKQYELGLEITQVVLQDVTPPEKVKASFHAVNEALQEKKRLINSAEAEYNREIPKARGEAQSTISEAEGYALQRVNQAKGDVASFNALFGEYDRAPEITKQRIYYETLISVMEQSENKTIVDNDLQGLLPVYKSFKGIQP